MVRNTFHEDLIRGKQGENEFIRLCGYLKFDVVDVSMDERFQNIDTDFVIRDPKGRVKKIEVKWCNVIHKSGNVFAETCSNVRLGNKGWLYKSDADVVFYGDSVNKVFHAFRIKDMREYCKKYRPREIVFDDWKNNKKVKGFLVNVFDFAKIGYTIPMITIPQNE